jgi:UDP-2,4-diacetamido-2,4,6-trideoxy-beta-L-altropyranose hydrolase
VNVLFRVDASPVIGTGHLMRCLALAQALEKSSVHTFFAVYESSLALCQSRNDWVGQLLVVPENLDVSKEALWLESVVRDHRVDALVLDGYQFNQAYRQTISNLSCANILFDDNNNSGSLHSNMVINGAENASFLGYNQTAPKAFYCVGSEYRILRQEFTHGRQSNWEQRDLLSICMGGSDPNNLLLPLLVELQAQSFDAPICVITGSAYQQLDKLQTFIEAGDLKFEHIHNCQNMADIFKQSKLVISAAGGTQFELLACQTPSLLLVVADNQLNATEHASQQGWCVTADARAAVDFNLLARQISEMWVREERLKIMCSAAKQHNSVEGAQRVVEAISELVKIQHTVKKGR